MAFFIATKFCHNLALSKINKMKMVIKSDMWFTFIVRILFIVTALCGHLFSFGQCAATRVIAKDYFSSQCGSHSFQSLVGAQVPVYNNKGKLQFTSPLTDNNKPSATQEVSEITLKVYPNPIGEILKNIQIHELLLAIRLE